MAWNAGDLEALSQAADRGCRRRQRDGTGNPPGATRSIALSAEQKQQPSYRDATITATEIHAIRLVTPDVALVDATYRMTGVRIPADSEARAVAGSILFVMVQQDGAWRIASIRALPPS